MTALALDIGGANLKAACEAGGAWSMPFALWKEPERLADRLAELARRAEPFDRLLVTLTAELCDCFATKRDGVRHVVAAAEKVAAKRPVKVWSTEGRFVTPAEARARPLKVAAANWHAQATWLAGEFPEGLSLLVDTGSTTTDILALHDGRAGAIGLTDTERLASGELVYLGAVRTPLMALGPGIAWKGKTHALMAELFATSADVLLLTGDLPEDAARTDTADGKPMTVEAAAARLVRMLGADTETIRLDDAIELAWTFRARMLGRIGEAIGQVLKDRVPHRLIVSGSGEALALSAARPRLPRVEVVRLAEALGDEASHAACAVALLKLEARA